VVRPGSPEKGECKRKKERKEDARPMRGATYEGKKEREPNLIERKGNGNPRLPHRSRKKRSRRMG